MLRRQSTTILLLTADGIIRADLAGGRVAALWQQPRPAVDDLPMLVDSALRLGGKGRRRVWVLTTDLWSQTLPVEAGATRGMLSDELARSLAFEVEPLSGISAFESALGHKAMATDGFHRHFWVVQLPIWQLTQIEEVVRQAGCSLGGVAHPGGLPRPVADTGQGAWQRVELWPDSVVAVQADAGKPPDTLVYNGGPAQDGWKPEIVRWLASRQPADRRVLLLSRTADNDRRLGDETEVLDLTDESVLTAWLAAWAEVLASDDPGLPIIQPAPQPMPAHTQILISAGLATLVAAGCWFIHTAHQKQIAETVAETRQLTERTEQFEAFDGEIQRRRDQLKTLTEDNERLLSGLDTYEAALAAQQYRVAALLTAVAEMRPEHLMIRKIEHDSGRLTISGSSLDPESANELAVSLDRRVRSLGWQVGLPHQQAGRNSADRTPWTFRLELKDIDVGGSIVREAERRQSAPVASRAQRERRSDR